MKHQQDINLKKREDSDQSLLNDVQACRICAASLPLEPRPILQIDHRARILIAGQAPGKKTHETAIPFDDLSGNRLREWMGVSKDMFYDEKKIAILPMGFCYPGAGQSGDLPPRPECAQHWREKLLNHLPDIQLTLVIGQYAMAYHLKEYKDANLTHIVRNWKHYWPRILPLPHPSPRNNIWLKKNPWFEKEVVPALRKKIVTLYKERG